MDKMPQAYACINKDEKIRKNSSSGGIFTLLAEQILDKQGVVFGAAFDENYHIIHTYIENKNELEKFRGSKYAQSKIGICYRQAKDFLDQGRYVLFTGTPCQVEGLKMYLKKEYDNLYTQDFICHGTPSHKVWEKYLEYRKNISGQEPEKISFRNKDDGWKLFNMKFEYSNSDYKKSENQDPYMQAFLKNASLREECYKCKFKKKNRVSDITLADFWGIENILPEMDDNKGTSLVIVHSEKGQQLFKDISSKMIYKQVDFDEAIKYNPSMLEVAKPDPKRKEFFKNLDKVPFDKLVKKYTYRRSFIKRVFSKTKKILIKLYKN